MSDDTPEDPSLNAGGAINPDIDTDASKSKRGAFRVADIDVRSKEPKNPVEHGFYVVRVNAEASLDPDISHRQFRVLAVMSMHCDQSRCTWIGQKRIAQLLGTHQANVSRDIKALEERGYIIKQAITEAHKERREGRRTLCPLKRATTKSKRKRQQMIKDAINEKAYRLDEPLPEEYMSYRHKPENDACKNMSIRHTVDVDTTYNNQLLKLNKRRCIRKWMRRVEDWWDKRCVPDEADIDAEARLIELLGEDPATKQVESVLRRMKARQRAAPTRFVIVANEIIEAHGPVKAQVIRLKLPDSS